MLLFKLKRGGERIIREAEGSSKTESERHPMSNEKFSKSNK